MTGCDGMPDQSRPMPRVEAKLAERKAIVINGR